MKRTKLFKLQGMLSILLVIIATGHYALNAAPAEFFKVAIAPFGAISLLLFSFFVYSKRREDLDDTTSYGTKRILLNLGIAVVTAAVVVLLTSILGDLTSSLDRIIFIFSVLTGGVVFIYEKLRDFKSMAILTGIGEGITILLIFFK